MGYTTKFFGSFNFDKPLSPEQIEYINMFSDTRRMGRDPNKLATMRAAQTGNTRCFQLLRLVGLPIGVNGDFYCGGGDFGQDHDESITDFNSSKQPGLWCQWVIGNTNSGNTLEWNGSEKFYNYVEWLKYMIEYFFKPWGYKLNGMVEWAGEERDDIGVIEITNNDVITHSGKTLSEMRKIVKSEKKAAKVAPVVKATNATMADMTLDLVKLRNKLAATSKGTKVAARMIDVLIAKYEA